MKAPLSDYWTVEYSFCSDAFSVRSLPQYLTDTQRSFHKARFFDSIVLALHQTRVDANEECSVWKERRDKWPLTPAERAAQLRRYVEAFEGDL